MDIAFLTREVFNQCCLNIQRAGESIGDFWFWNEFKHDKEQRFLHKVSTIPWQITPNKAEERSHGLEDELFEDNETHDLECEVVVPLAIQKEQKNTFIKMEHHVVYSDNYSVPVLYFNGSYQDGRPITLQEVWNSIPEHYQHAMRDKWSFITQQEHPYLQRPFFQVHPCHTETMLKTLLPEKSKCENTLLMWLSAIAPIVHLELSMHYFTNKPAPQEPCDTNG
eukprot:TCONS_00055077-protein